MNRIFFAMVLVAFVVTGWRQVTWAPPPPAPEVTLAPVPGTDSADPVVRGLAEEVARLRSAAPPDAAPTATSPMQDLQRAMFDKADASVTLAISLIGSLAFFLGLVRVADDAGAVDVLTRLIRPLLVRLFPDVPADHPAMGAMVLNLAANALGLDNAATPFGLKAMAELDRLNRHKGTATNAMALFLAINTSSVTLLPLRAITWRERLGSASAADVVPTTLLATLISTTVAIVAARTYQRFVATPEAVTPPEDVAPIEPYDAVATDAYPTWVSVLALAALATCVPLSVLYGRVVAPWVVPTMTVAFLSFGAWRGVPVFASFVEGAREGWQIAVRIVPYLVAVLVAVGMIEASGVLDAVIAVVDPVTRRLGLPAAAVPMALLRPLSGSGASGLMVSTLSNPLTGPDTYTGLLVSTLHGSTETTFYVLAVYYGAVQVRRFRHTLAAALTADVAGVVGAVLATSLFFAFRG